MTNKCISQKLIFWLACCTLLGLFLPMSASAAASPVGVAYRGHIQDLGDYPADGSWVDSPKIIGTEGQSKRIEGFEIKLTGAIPTDLQNGLELRYNVHVQNKGWLYDENDSANWPKDGDYAGTRGESLRIEAVKIVLTDADGKAVSGYSVQYRGHVQNVGNLPTDESQWLADGAQLGTVGSSLRLEALLVKVVKNETDLAAYTALVTQIEKLKAGDFTVQSWGRLQTALKEHLVTTDQSQTAVDAAVKAIQLAYDGLEKKAAPTVYDKAGTFGPAIGTQTIAGDVTVNADGVILQNLKIEGDLTIAEAVGNGTVTLNNVTVVGDTFVRGGGKNSIHINGGQYSRIVMEKTASGAVRIVATGVDGLDVVISEDAAGETIILEGAFDSVVVNAPNMAVTTQGSTTTIGKMTVGKEATGSTVNLAAGTTVTDLLLDAKVAVKGQGTVAKAEVKADGVTFDKAPGSYTVEPGVVIPPVFPTPDNGGGGGGGGYTPPTSVAVTGVSLNKTALSLSLNASETLVAAVAPTDATNKAVTWTTSNASVATVGTDGKVTGITEGTATITVTTQDGNKTATCAVTVKNLNPAITGLTMPFHGDTPDATIVDTNQYSGTVAWREQGGGNDLLATDVFDGAKTYVATITLVMKAPYTAADIPANFFTVDGKTAVNSAGSGVITLAFSSVPQYRINSSGVITAYSGPGGAVVIPNTIVTPGGAIAITGIGDSAFKNRGLTGITLPETVLNISSFAFAENNLTAVVIPDRVNTIDNKAFYMNTTLTAVTLPSHILIAPSAFEGDPITRITIGDSANIFSSMGTMGDFGMNFIDYYQETTTDKPARTAGHYRYTAGVWQIDNGLTFSGATITAYDQSKGPYVFIPAKNGGTLIKTMKDGDFGNGVRGVFEAIGLKTLAFASDSAITTIGDHAFTRNQLEAVSLPNTVTTIKGGAFLENKKLKNVTLSANLISIGSGAFEACALESISLPANLTTIASYAFETNQLRNTLTIPASVTTIGNSAFFDNQISSLVIEGPDRVLTIDSRAFGSTGAGNPITRITIPAGVAITPNIGYGGSTMGLYGAKFQDAYSAGGAGIYNYDSGSGTWIKEIIAVGGMSPVVGATAAASTATDTRFDGTVAWTVDGTTPFTGSFVANKAYTATITLTPKTPYVFSDRIVFTVAGGTIKSTNIVGGKAIITADFPLLEYGINDAGVITAYYGAGGDVTIPDMVNGKTVTGIGDNVFASKANLSKIEIPASVKIIGAEAFAHCTALARVSFKPNSTLTTIGASAFWGIPLTAIEIPASVESIGINAFSSCLALTSVSFAPNSALKTIGDGAFWSCPLTTIPIPAKVETIGKLAFAKCQLSAIEIPASVKTIDEDAFSNCASLASVSFAPGSTLITINKGAFYNCPLTAIQIPASVKTIVEDAFSNCTQLTSVSFAPGSALTTIGGGAFGSCPLTTIQIPASVDSIGAYAFYASGLTSITFNGNAPKTIDSNAILAGTAIYYYSDKSGFLNSTVLTIPKYILVPILAAPGTLTATPTVGSSDAVELTWDAVTKATNYQLYYGTSADTMSAYDLPLAALATGNQGTINGLTPGTTYFFGVKAMDSIGESLLSTPVSAVTNNP